MADLQALFDKVKARDPDQKEFLQAVEEVLTTLEPVLKKRPELIPVVERLCEPERQILFRVPWYAPFAADCHKSVHQLRSAG